MYFNAQPCAAVVVRLVVACQVVTKYAYFLVTPPLTIVYSIKSSQSLVEPKVVWQNYLSLNEDELS